MLESGTIYKRDCLEFLRELADDSVDMVFSSPPYPFKGQRYDRNRRTWKLYDWLEWMLEVIKQSVRVSRGYVFYVVNNCVRKHQLQPAVQGLMWKAFEAGIMLDMEIIWHSNKPPTRGPLYFSNHHETVMAFKPVEKPYADMEAISEPKKYQSGGNFRQRNGKGQRVNGSAYPTGKLACPGDVVRFTVGGGHLSLNSIDEEFVSKAEAPFPIKMAQFFVKGFCPAEGIVLDPFMGAGTTALAAETLGRHWIGCDNGKQQIKLANERLVAYRMVD